MIRAMHAKMRIGIFSMQYGMTNSPAPHRNGTALACLLPYMKYPRPMAPVMTPMNNLVGSILPFCGACRQYCGPGPGAQYHSRNLFQEPDVTLHRFGIFAPRGEECKMTNSSKEGYTWGYCTAFCGRRQGEDWRTATSYQGSVASNRGARAIDENVSGMSLDSFAENG